MSERAQLAHGLIDVDFLHKPKMIAFVSRFGHAAVTFMLEIILQCSRSSSGWIDGDTYNGLMRMFGISNHEELLDYCIQNDMLMRNDNKISNQRVLEDQEKLFKRREQDRQRQEKRRDKSVTEPVTRGVTPVTETVSDTDTTLRSKKDGVRYFGEFAEIDEIQYEQHAAAKGIDYLNRCFELINGWVGEVQGDPEEFKKRRLRAKNAGFLFQNWVFQRVDREREEAARRKGPIKPGVKPSQNVINQMASDQAVEIYLKGVE